MLMIWTTTPHTSILFMKYIKRHVPSMPSCISFLNVRCKCPLNLSVVKTDNEMCIFLVCTFYHESRPFVFS